jgi:hypothetical protein
MEGHMGISFQAQTFFISLGKKVYQILGVVDPTWELSIFIPFPIPQPKLRSAYATMLSPKFNSVECFESKGSVVTSSWRPEVAHNIERTSTRDRSLNCASTILRPPIFCADPMGFMMSIRSLGEFDELYLGWFVSSGSRESSDDNCHIEKAQDNKKHEGCERQYGAQTFPRVLFVK